MSVGTSTGLFGTRFCDTDAFVEKRADPEELKSIWTRIVCIDDMVVVLETEDGRLYEIKAYAECMLSDCSDLDDPYGGIEVFRLYPR